MPYNFSDRSFGSENIVGYISLYCIIIDISGCIKCFVFRQLCLCRVCVMIMFN